MSNVLSCQKESELYLQSVVAGFVSEYTVHMTKIFQSSERCCAPGELIHIGAGSGQGLMWGTSYLHLRKSSDGKLRFFIKTGDNCCADHGRQSPEFLCTIWTRDDVLNFELADRIGRKLALFKLDVIETHFYPVIEEILRQINSRSDVSTV